MKKSGVTRFFLFMICILSFAKINGQIVYETLPMKVLTFGDDIYKIGDFNKDGYDDFIKGVMDPNPENEYTDPGLAILYLGSPFGPVYKATLEMTDNWTETGIGYGDFNGDGYDDVVTGHYWQTNPIDFKAFGALKVYYGNKDADVSTFIEIVGDKENDFGHYVTSLGDLNKDGYDDISVSSQTGIYIYYGSSTGLPLIKSLYLANYYFSFAAGDINNDGFDDFYATYFDEANQTSTLNLFFGSSAGPVLQGPVTEIFQAVGDFNKDGFNDLVSNSNSTVFFYYGSINGFIKSDQTIINIASYSKPDDLNNDGFLDLFIKKQNNQNLEIYLGSSQGFLPNPSIIVQRPVEEEYLLQGFGSLGDTNKDGITDFFTIYDSVYIYPGLKTPTIACPQDTIVYLRDSCEIKVNNIDPPGNPDDFKYTIIGKMNAEGNGTVSGKIFQSGQYLITYSRISDENTKCSFILTIADSTKPIVLSKPEGTYCNILPGQPGIELIKIKDCSEYQITYNVNSKNGTGADISKDLVWGINEVSWIISDDNGNITRTSSTITLIKNNFNVRITKAYQINATQSQANTIYLGYANNTIRLTAYEPNSSNHKYRWSNGDTTRYTRIRHNVPGKYEYSVIVTNDIGCSDTATTIITAIDNSCPNQLKDFISQHFPQLLDQPWIQALIISTTQMYLCSNGSTVCVNPNKVSSMVANGARLGKCGILYQSNDLITAKEEFNSVGALKLTASPNPSVHDFTIKIEGTKGRAYALQIINSIGTQVFVKRGITENVVRAGGSFQKGIYFAEVICGKERKVIKLLKIR